MFVLLEHLIIRIPLPTCRLLLESFLVLLTRLPGLPFAHLALPLETVFPPDFLCPFKRFENVRSHLHTFVTIEVEQKRRLRGVLFLARDEQEVLRRTRPSDACMSVSR